MKHWLRFLPKAGAPLIARAEECEALQRKIVRSQRRLLEIERDLSCSIRGDFTDDEIRAARVDAARASLDEDLTDRATLEAVDHG